jgi:DNA phosphorothioation-dependent restriction protein DptG
MEVMTYTKKATLERLERQSANETLEKLVNRIKNWHYDRNLIDGATDKDQLAKLIQEMGELSDNICKGKDVADDIGDIMVVLINIAERNGLSLRHCLEVAYSDIKDRKGKMVDGVFVKESDAE